jgi:hypothetical protein
VSFKKISESSENDPEQLAHTSENSPVLSLSETDSKPVESEASQTGATKSDLEPSVSATDSILNRIYQCINIYKGGHLFLPPLASSCVCFLNSF